MSAVTLVSRELGSLLDPRNQELINLFIELYDGAQVYEKVTKMSGNDTIEAPWINLLGATTPSWIAQNVPQSALGGGFISRCIFLYGEEKERLIPYPSELIRNQEVHAQVRAALVHDLEHMATNLAGPIKLTPDAIAWGSAWYKELWTGAKSHYNDDKLMGYIARKQTHMHKLAMVLAASYKDDMTITAADLQKADKMLASVEISLDKVFAQIGKSDMANQSEKFIGLIERRGAILYAEAYRLVHSYFPDARDFEGVLAGAIRSGQLELVNHSDGKIYLKIPSFKLPQSYPNSPPKSDLPNASTETEAPNL